MAAFQAMKIALTSGGAVAVLTGFSSGVFLYASKHAIAAEREPSATDSNTGKRGLSCAPQFDGLECFETIVSTGKHPRSGKQPTATTKVVQEKRCVAIAPQFDGLNCFETFIYKN